MIYKLVRVIPLLIGLIFICSTVSCRKADITSPEKLISRPVINEEKSKIYERIDNIIPASSSLVLPNNSTQVGKINYIDLDLDGNKEIIAFVKNERIGEANQVGFIVYSYGKDKKITELYKYLTEGENIDYANFINNSSKGGKNILILTRNGINFEIANFGRRDENTKNIEKLSDYDVDDSDVKILVANTENNRGKNIFLIKDAKDYKVEVSLLEFDEEDQIVQSDVKTISDVKNMRDINISFGEIYNGINAFLLEYPLQSDQSIQTQAFVNRFGKLVEIFNYDNKYLKKPQAIRIEDIDGDGTLDFPNIDNGIATKLSDVGDRYYSSMINWYDWNGQMGKGADMLLIDKIYSNYNYNFRLSIPRRLASRIFIKQREEQEITYFDIFYIDTEDTKRNKLYTLIVKNNSSSDESSKGNDFKDAYLLKKSENYVFGVIQQNKQITDKLKFDLDELKNNFSLIYE